MKTISSQAAHTPLRAREPLLPEIGKGIILLSVLFLSFCVLLLSPVLTIADHSIAVSISISGIQAMIALFGGGAYQASVAGIGVMTVQLPVLPTALMLVGMLLILICMAVTAAVTFRPVWRRYQRVASAGAIGVSVLYFIALYIALIFSERIAALDLYGQQSVFYREYAVGSSWLIAIVLCLLAAALAFFLKGRDMAKVRKNWSMYLLLLVPTLLMLVFSLYPMFLQLILSFKDYKIAGGIWGSDWIGLDNFVKIFTDATMLRVIGNTLLISVCRMFISIVPPILLAIFLFDMGHDRLRKGLQTILYIPHFFSWIVIYGIAYAFISPEGLINSIVKVLGGESVKILTSEKAFIPLLLITDLWKEVGWGTILFLAALTNVDTTLYEAAALDGAGPVKRLIHITLPSIAATIVFVTVMAVGNLLRGAGFEQIMLFGSENMQIAQVIDTWVIWKGLNRLEYGLGAAVSFFQSAIGFAMVVSCNWLSKKTVGIGLY